VSIERRRGFVGVGGIVRTDSRDAIALHRDREQRVRVRVGPRVRRAVRHPSGKNSETKAPLYADWTIEARDGGKTTLRLVHSGFSVGAEWDDELGSHARGWQLMLQNLRQYFARHPHVPAVHLPFMTKVESSRGSLWKTLLGRLGVSTTPKVGDAFRFTTPDGQVLTGVVDFLADTYDLALVVREYDDALLRFTTMGKLDGSSTFVYGYAIAYGAASVRASSSRPVTARWLVDSRVSHSPHEADLARSSSLDSRT
jgi:hypothetical protein